MIVNYRYRIDFEAEELQMLVGILLKISSHFSKPGFVKSLDLSDEEKEFIDVFVKTFTDESDSDL
ncbi:MAG: hypothetical protein PWQ06_1656 [Anaerophaga sp.]|nr:hypothetical protein [Anaerophaga sp.]